MTANRIKIRPRGLAGSLIIGGLAGAGAALMFSPVSGKEARQRIRDLSEDIRCKTQNYGRKVSGKVTSFLGRGRELLKRKNS